MTNAADKARIKQKMLGVRIQAARMQAGHDVATVAAQIGITADQLTAYEQGQADTNLPELEALAQICNVPISYFLTNGRNTPDNMARRISIRQKMIGARISQIRHKQGRSQAELAAAIDSTPEQVAAFESGQQVIPFRTIEAIAAYFELPLAHFLDRGAVSEASPAASLVEPQSSAVATQEPEPAISTADGAQLLPADMAWIADLPEEERTFLSDPTNLLYLKLSMKLQPLPTDTLRRLAEGILDITY